MASGFVIRPATLLAASLLGIVSTTQAQPIHVSAEGIGQVLIYPYYTTRNGWTTLLSIVNNDAANGKAIKVRFLEGKNGALVASLNVFLAANDIWTGAVAAGSADDQPPRLLSNDTSCTWPNIRAQRTTSETGVIVTAPNLTLSNQAYVADGDSVAQQTIDRTREGYVEAIEMASIPVNRTMLSPLTQQIDSGGYYYSPPPSCLALTDADLFRYAGDVIAPKGGLSGSATLVNVTGGASADYVAVALDAFWTAAAASSLGLTTSASALPNLTSGGNLTAQNAHRGKTYFSSFNRSIDAVSAVLMNEQLLGEHAYTSDSSIGTTWVVTDPTKRFYTQGASAPPFSSAWNGSAGNACDEIELISSDRAGIVLDESTDFGVRPFRPLRALCFAAGTLNFGGVTTTGRELIFNSTNSYAYSAGQDGGHFAVPVGMEGGKTRLTPKTSFALLTSISGSVISVDAGTGTASIAVGPHTFYGLPMIGVAFTQSSLKLGNPQQNFASGYRLQSTRRITSP